MRATSWGLVAVVAACSGKHADEPAQPPSRAEQCLTEQPIGRSLRDVCFNECIQPEAYRYNAAVCEKAAAIDSTYDDWDEVGFWTYVCNRGEPESCAWVDAHRAEVEAAKPGWLAEQDAYWNHDSGGSSSTSSSSSGGGEADEDIEWSVSFEVNSGGYWSERLPSLGFGNSYRIACVMDPSKSLYATLHYQGSDHELEDNGVLDTGMRRYSFYVDSWDEQNGYVELRVGATTWVEVTCAAVRLR